MPPPPLVLHVLFRFATGGLENGVVNLINHMQEGRFRHAIVALDTVDDGFASRLRHADVRCVALHKPPGNGLRAYPSFLRLLRELRPAIVHTRNLAALEFQPAAAWAGVPVRIHGEHGWDAADPSGLSQRQRWIRRLYAPFVHRYVTVSQDLARYLTGPVGIARARVQALCNGVDAERFRPRGEALTDCPFDPTRHWIVGTVGRLQEVKHQTLLVRAFARALELAPPMRADARLAIIGDGPLRSRVESAVAETGMVERVWMAGERRDVPEAMRTLQVFVLPSLAEGISNTILEAMASGLPVLATSVGGNPELVAEDRTGQLVPADDIEAMARALVHLYTDRATAERWGRAARAEVEARFSLQAMVEGYATLYDRELQRRG